MSHRGEGNAVLVISQFSHNLSVSLNNTNTAKNLKHTQVEHACSFYRSPVVGAVILFSNNVLFLVAFWLKCRRRSANEAKMTY